MTKLSGRTVLGRYTWTGGILNRLMIGGGLELEHEKRMGVHAVDRPLTVDLFTSYRWRRNWSLQLNLNNITDERYIVQIAGTGLVQTSDTRRAKLTLRYAW